MDEVEGAVKAAKEAAERTAKEAAAPIVNGVKYSNKPAQVGLKGTIDVKKELVTYITSDAKIMVNDSKLQGHISELYRGKPAGQMYGDGGVADAVRYTKQTGIQVGGSDHLIKAQDRINGLNNWLKQTPNPTQRDKTIANLVLNDLINALNSL